MLQQTEGKMYLASECGHTENNWFRSYNTFSFGTYQQPYKTPFGPLYVLNNNTLAGGRSFVQFLDEDADVNLIPVVGAIYYTDSTGNKVVLKAGEAQKLAVNKGTTFEISNPFEDALVNFIQIQIKRLEPGRAEKSSLSTFNVTQDMNRLLFVFPDSQQQKAGSYNISIGKFNGRQEAVYKLAKPDNGVFFFVLQGAFEVQYRLLEALDGLSLCGLEEAGVEALSNDALILLIEVPLM